LAAFAKREHISESISKQDGSIGPADEGNVGLLVEVVGLIGIVGIVGLVGAVGAIVV